MSDFPEYVAESVERELDGQHAMGTVKWARVVLAHPDGKAAVGDLCVKCGEPIPDGLFWLLSERHVCSHRCGDNLKRQANAYAKRLRGEVRSRFEHRWDPPREVKFRDAD